MLKILRTVTNYIVINSTNVQQHMRETISCQYCIAFEVMLLFLVLTGRIAEKRHTDVIKFTHMPKIRFFAPQERLLASIHVKLGSTDGHLGPPGCAKFHLNRRSGLESGPQKYKKMSTFWYRVASRWRTLDRFLLLEFLLYA